VDFWVDSGLHSGGIVRRFGLVARKSAACFASKGLTLPLRPLLRPFLHGVQPS
jgi:hypothetical protein